MSSNDRRISDLLFVVQIIGAVVFCGGYALQSLTDVTGSSVVQFGLVALYLLLHLWLGVGAHRVAPSRVTRQAIFTYSTWVALMSVVIIVAATNPDYRWNEKETTTLLTAVALTVAVLLISSIRRLTIRDPMTKASLAIAYKSVPQLLLGWKFLAEGASGTPMVSLVMGHITIFIRLGQIYFMVREAGWDRNRIWLAISETANELSWILATIAWIIVM